MPKKKRTSKTSNGTAVGARKTRLSRLELFLMGKGPTAATARRMYGDSFKTKVGR